MLDEKNIIDRLDDFRTGKIQNGTQLCSLLRDMVSYYYGTQCPKINIDYKLDDDTIASFNTIRNSIKINGNMVDKAINGEVSFHYVLSAVVHEFVHYLQNQVTKNADKKFWKGRDKEKFLEEYYESAERKIREMTTYQRKMNNSLKNTAIIMNVFDMIGAIYNEKKSYDLLTVIGIKELCYLNFKHEESARDNSIRKTSQIYLSLTKNESCTPELYEWIKSQQVPSLMKEIEEKKTYETEFKGTLDIAFLDLITAFGENDALGLKLLDMGIDSVGQIDGVNEIELDKTKFPYNLLRYIRTDKKIIGAYKVMIDLYLKDMSLDQKLDTLKICLDSRGSNLVKMIFENIDNSINNRERKYVFDNLKEYLLTESFDNPIKIKNALSNKKMFDIKFISELTDEYIKQNKFDYLSYIVDVVEKNFISGLFGKKEAFKVIEKIVSAYEKFLYSIGEKRELNDKDKIILESLSELDTLTYMVMRVPGRDTLLERVEEIKKYAVSTYQKISDTFYDSNDIVECYKKARSMSSNPEDIERISREMLVEIEFENKRRVEAEIYGQAYADSKYEKRKALWLRTEAKSHVENNEREDKLVAEMLSGITKITSKKHKKNERVAKSSLKNSKDTNSTRVL